MKRQFTLLILLFAFAPFFAQAQEKASENYNPPPLFSAPHKLPPVKKIPDSIKDLKLPKLSKPPEDFPARDDIEKQEELVEPEIVTQAPDDVKTIETLHPLQHFHFFRHL